MVGANLILRIKEQETCLTLREFDDDERRFMDFSVL